MFESEARERLRAVVVAGEGLVADLRERLAELTPGSYAGTVSICDLSDARRRIGAITRAPARPIGAWTSHNRRISEVRAYRRRWGGASGGGGASENRSEYTWVRTGGAGLDATGGAFDVVHATVTGCTAGGIRKGSTHGGMAINSIAFANPGGNFPGYAPNEIRNSNGDPAAAGTNGNINADPMFTDAPNGDLTLRPGSPSLNAGDFAAALAVGRDHDEASRILDHDLSGLFLPDMGAFERAFFRLTVGGRPRLGTVMGFTATGGPGTALFVLGFLNGETLLPPLGIVKSGPFPGVVLLGIPPTETGFPLPIPDINTLIGFPFGVEAAALSSGTSAGIGNITNLYRGRIFR